jgi:hypothetical protein
VWYNNWCYIFFSTFNELSLSLSLTKNKLVLGALSVFALGVLVGQSFTGSMSNLKGQVTSSSSRDCVDVCTSGNLCTVAKPYCIGISPSTNCYECRTTADCNGGKICSASHVCTSSSSTPSSVSTSSVMPSVSSTSTSSIFSSTGMPSVSSSFSSAPAMPSNYMMP